jgi:hypothetical protein
VWDQIPLFAKMQIDHIRGYVDTFLAYDGPLTASASEVGGWVLNDVTGAATVTRQAAKGSGVIRLATSALGNADACLTRACQFGYVVGKRLWYFTRIALSDPDNMIVHCGLGTPGVIDWGGTLPAEGIFFEKADTANGVFDFHVRDNGTSTEDADIGTTFSTADSFFILGFYVNPTGDVHYYYGTDVNQMTLAGTVAAGTANLPDDAGDELSFAWNVETGNGEVDYIDIDWVLVLQEA